jgi:muconolactone delta-isomerase
VQFMASISLDHQRRAEIEQLVPAEAARVRELQHEGVMKALYLPDGNGAPGSLWAIFSGESSDFVQRALESLPLYPYMHVELTPLRSVEARA